MSFGLDVAAITAGLPDEVTIAVASVAATMREGLMAFSTAAGLAVFQTLLHAELESKIGPKHAKQPDTRVGNWHGTTSGQVVLGGRKISVERPRGRHVGGGEIASETWDVFAADDLANQVIVERMLAGVATRRHVAVGDPVAEDLAVRAVSKSTASRRFVAATEKAMIELLSRDLSEARRGGVDDRWCALRRRGPCRGPAHHHGWDEDPCRRRSWRH